MKTEVDQQTVKTESSPEAELFTLTGIYGEILIFRASDLLKTSLHHFKTCPGGFSALSSDWRKSCEFCFRWIFLFTEKTFHSRLLLMWCYYLIKAFNTCWCLFFTSEFSQIQRLLSQTFRKYSEERKERKQKYEYSVKILWIIFGNVFIQKQKVALIFDVSSLQTQEGRKRFFIHNSPDFHKSDLIYTLILFFSFQSVGGLFFLQWVYVNKKYFLFLWKCITVSVMTQWPWSIPEYLSISSEYYLKVKRNNSLLYLAENKNILKSEIKIIKLWDTLKLY